ncbi:LHFPL tetraspan subfamily member 3 protein-like [Homarus americanus]|uniref:LHFPL tetraspan subfamily member 3 protein-like n=1 Tax=Homarus americanus TaxID=6706 RepID=UPI001C48F626|nr:LHFPL tetraspan subfamily member 3 protein-like [Homarus americanus]XP_042235489.1 LHFPL tetraspan subfamily member 3 protein-like [Homarus americanus]XP_042235490.1 LHFPL tetraspan subfamily member 3 protein-like [Homarus americanus]XP_042235491.1 LHFPL tetraspan subfamily member 3 protein-like [Homarus americanus]XP_042235492.1 LHFPL tetraspan subfamily member 3 protein-like [Homarus americanus]
MKKTEKNIEYADQAHIYTTNYIRNSKAIGVLWGVFTICFAIINIVVFVQPQWIGDTQDSKGTGYFGLWKWCAGGREGTELECTGKLDDFTTLLNIPSKAATILVGLSVVITLLCICSMLLFFFFHSSTVFHMAGSMQLLSAILLLVGVVVFPAGWAAGEVRKVCGPTARQYNMGECEVRWAYILAIIGILDAAVLSALAFVLATRHVKLQAEPEPLYGGSVYKGQMNAGFVGDAGSLAGSRKSLNLQPVMLMPHPDNDRFSEFSHHTGRSKNSAYRAHYASSVQNFQL